MAIGTGTALLASAAIGAGTSYLGGKSAKKAAKTNATQQVAAAQQAFNRIDNATNQFNRANPYAAMGPQIGSRLSGLMGYTDWPGTPPPAGSYPAGVMPAGAAPAGTPSIFGAPANGGALPGDMMGGRDLTGTSAAMPGHSLHGVPNGGGMQPGEMPSGGDGRTEFLRNTPGYQFMMKEGMDQLQHSLGAQNALYSGAAMKAIVQQAQGYADQSYDDAVRREMAMGDRVASSAQTTLAAQTGNAQLMQAAQSDAANLRHQGSNEQLAGTMGGIKAITDGAMSIWGPKG